MKRTIFFILVLGGFLQSVNSQNICKATYKGRDGNYYYAYFYDYYKSNKYYSFYWEGGVSFLTDGSPILNGKGNLRTNNSYGTKIEEENCIFIQGKKDGEAMLWDFTSAIVQKYNLVYDYGNLIVKKEFKMSDDTKLGMIAGTAALIYGLNKLFSGSDSKTSSSSYNTKSTNKKISWFRFCENGYRYCGNCGNKDNNADVNSTCKKCGKRNWRWYSYCDYKEICNDSSNSNCRYEDCPKCGKHWYWGFICPNCNKWNLVEPVPGSKCESCNYELKSEQF